MFRKYCREETLAAHRRQILLDSKAGGQPQGVGPWQRYGIEENNPLKSITFGRLGSNTGGSRREAGTLFETDKGGPLRQLLESGYEPKRVLPCRADRVAGKQSSEVD
jgi:hypothetical protein